ncbi:MAG: hypothetical protein OEW35_05245 [Gammaproteobacteria bacterium]|nr:hypothetical protein [Gammaproteobacteria bacterium]MDH4253118.1 hypothetical protein [Gammaproteobacteria bacterium]MDH5308945.1 hypothetical protein [Gammaproteobacteria bacterium]
MASLFDELKRRNVFRVGIAYAVAGWVLAQVAEFAFENFGAPDWVLKSFVVALALGLPIALIVAWAFELTPEGIKRERDVDRSTSITRQTGRKLDFVIIAVLAVAVVMLLADRLWLSEATQPAAPEVGEVVATTGRQSIAVLPFVNMSGDDDYFADGLSEELLNLLANIPELKVAGRTSSFVFKNKTEDLRAIGDALGVDTVLEGSVRRSGDRLRVTAQLVNVGDGFHLWSQTYDRRMADIFDIQDDVAGAIAGALKLHFLPRRAEPTTNAAAYDLYLQALSYITSNEDPRTLNIVVPLLDQAITYDPGFAKAHELKALAYWGSAGERIESPAARPLVYESASAALAVDPTLVVARLLASIAEPGVGNWKRAIEATEAAYRAAPGDYNVARVLCDFYLVTGYVTDALHCAERMLELEPLSSLSHFRQGAALRGLGRRQEARESWRRAIDVGGTVYWSNIGMDEFVAGEYDAAIGSVGRFEKFGWTVDDVRTILEGVTASGGGEKFLREWIAVKGAEAPDNISKVLLLEAYLQFGYLDAYWRAIGDIVTAEDPVWNNADWLLRDGIIFRAHEFMKHPAYLDYARRGSIIDLWDARGAPDFCSKIGGEWTCE